MKAEIFIGPIPIGKTWHNQLPNPEFDKIFEQAKCLTVGACLRIECADVKEGNRLCAGLRHRAKKFHVPLKAVMRGKDVYAYLERSETQPVAP